MLIIILMLKIVPLILMVITLLVMLLLIISLIVLPLKIHQFIPLNKISKLNLKFNIYPCCLTCLRVSEEDVDLLRWFLPPLVPGLCWFPGWTVWSKVGLLRWPLNTFDWAGVDEREPPDIKSRTSLKWVLY